MAGRRKLRLRLSEAQNHRCVYCTEFMTLDYMKPTSATLEHVIPRSQGGSDGESNLVVACSACNHARGNTSLIYFMTRRNPNYRRNPEDAAYISELYRIAKPEPEPIVPTLPHRIKAVSRLVSLMEGFSTNVEIPKSIENIDRQNRKDFVDRRSGLPEGLIPCKASANRGT